MAPTRNPALDEGFESVPGDSTQVKCGPCSASHLTPILLKTASRKAHLQSASHHNAVEEALPEVQPRQPSHHSPSPPRQAAVSLSQWGFPSSNEEDPIIPDAEPFNPFVGGHRHNGQYFDENGEEIFLAENLPPAEAVEHATLLGQMDDLSMFEHSILDPRTSDLNEFFGQGQENAPNIDSESEPDHDDYRRVDPETDWAPYESKTMCMIDALDSFPRLQLSEDQLKAAMWVMRECGTPNIPLFSALCKVQAMQTKTLGLTPEPHTSALGNKFFMNHPNRLFALDFANPLVRKQMHLYPEITDTISETWQAAKMLKGYGLDDYSPMWADWKNLSHRHFYVRELAQLKDGKYILPLRWVEMNGEVQFQAYNVEYHPEDKLFTVKSDVTLIVKANQLARNMPEIQAEMDIHYPDDVSGNVNKQFNAHTNTYYLNAGIPHRTLAQEYFVRFGATSQHASSTEQFDALREHLDEWTSAYDCELEQEIMFKVNAHILPADNPQQAENCSHVGAHGNLFCRRCKVGGDDTHRESDAGYAAYYTTGEPRTAAETIDIIEQQLWTSCAGVAKDVDTLQTEFGVKDKIALFWIDRCLEKSRTFLQTRLSDKTTRDPRLNDRRIKYEAREAVKTEIKDDIQLEVLEWLIQQPPDHYAKLPDHASQINVRSGDHYNCLLDGLKGIDPHSDTAGEILHTYLLGGDRYIWYATSKSWEKDTGNGPLFATRLQGASVDGVSVGSLRARYMVQYKNALIGKHYKTLQQLAVFSVYGLCEDLVFDLWKASGELGAYLWFPEIQNVDEYMDDIQVLIDNVLDIWGRIDPTRIQTKLKLHIFPHLKKDILRFGPAIIFSTKIFEGWNAVFRGCSIHSNHLAPSHDIATTLGEMERFKHQVSGGWWKSEDGEWIQAGPKVRTFLTGNKELQRRLGYVIPPKLTAGTVKPLSKVKQALEGLLTLQESLGALWSDSLTTEYPLLDLEAVWSRGKSVLAQSHDLCKGRSFVFLNIERNGATVTLIGQIFKILFEGATTLVVLEEFDLGAERCPRLGMPVLTRTVRLLLVYPKPLQFIFNAQHDCVAAKCTFVKEPVIQGCETTTLEQDVLRHSEDSCYHLNMHGIHNAHWI